MRRLGLFGVRVVTSPGGVLGSVSVRSFSGLPEASLTLGGQVRRSQAEQKSWEALVATERNKLTVVTRVAAALELGDDGEAYEKRQREVETAWVATVTDANQSTSTSTAGKEVHTSAASGAADKDHGGDPAAAGSIEEGA